MIPLASINLRVNDSLGVVDLQVRFPKSRAKRVRKKWRKNPRNWRRSWEPVYYHVPALNVVMTNTRGMHELRAHLAQGHRAEPNSYRGLFPWP